MVRLFFTLMLVWISHIVGAQITQTNTNTSAHLRDVYFINALTGFAVGDSGTIIKSTDGGMNWATMMEDDAVVFRRVRFFNGQRGLALGSDIYMTSDAGLNWNKVSTTNNTVQYVDIEIVNDSTCFITNGNGDLLKSTDHGQTFSIIYQDASNQSSLISFINDSVGYACAYSGGLSTKTNKTVDGGYTWATITDSSQTPNPTVMEDMIFISEDIGFKAGWYNAHLQKTTNGGNDWGFTMYADSNVTYQLIDLFIDTAMPNAYYACGWYGEFYKSTDGGETWLGIATGVSSVETLYATFFIDELNGWVCGTNGLLLKITNGGIGLDENEGELAFDLYPNPANKHLSISYQKNLPVLELLVINSVGKIVIQKTSNFNELDVSSLKNGAYFLKVKTRDGFTTRRFLKQ